MVTLTPLIPALLPLATLIWLRVLHDSVPIARNDFLNEYDFIVGKQTVFFTVHTRPNKSINSLVIQVGAGSAGAALANRLSELDDRMVLLIEAGGSENVLSDIPIAAATLQMTTIDWAYQSEPQEAACFGLINRRSRWPRGRVLGGSSVLNYMLYVRGNARDYDKWERLGNPGWSWSEVLPYFIKSEDNQDPDTMANGRFLHLKKLL